MNEVGVWAGWLEPGSKNPRRFLLPVGELTSCRLRLEASVWGNSPRAPDRHPIGVTVEVLKDFERQMFIDPASGAITIEQEPGGAEVDLVNSSTPRFVASVGLHCIWHGLGQSSMPPSNYNHPLVLR